MRTFAEMLVEFCLRQQRERAASVDTHAERCDVKQAQPARVGSAVGEAETPNLPHLTQEERRQLRLNITERYSKSLESLSDDATTDEDLIERARRCSPQPSGDPKTKALINELADALVSRTSEVERLQHQLQDMLAIIYSHGLQVSREEMDQVREARAALSQHRKV